MNNRYTFKGKTKQGKWVYGNLLEPKRMYSFNGIDRSDKFCLIVESSFANGGWVTVGTKHWVLKETLCQCTGLKDRDGKDIFENDIVEYIYEVNNSPFKANEQGVISYESTGFYYETIKGTQKYGSRAGWLVSIPNDNGKLFKIIGNKFDKEED